MSLKNRLLNEMKTAMKNKDTIRKNTIQMVRAAILQAEKDKQIELDNDSIIEVITKEVKKRKSALPDYEKSNRHDLVENLNEEIRILNEFLPEQLSEEEIKNIVKDAIEEVKAESMKDMGKIMANVMPKVKGRADGKIVNKIVKDCLS